MDEIKIKKFNTRDDLDSHIEALPNKENVLIVGTEKELKKLHLKVGRKVFGVSCKVIKNKK